jgi:cytochrome c biogenesis protein CcmG/thiol:disulfide interchange protein DsbE
MGQIRSGKGDAAEARRCHKQEDELQSELAEEKVRIGRRAFIAYLPAGLTGLKGNLVQREARSVAPDFTLPNLDGKPVALSDFGQNIVVLDFWATWCHPCVAELPNLNALQEKYASRGLRVVGIVVESGSVKDIRKFLTKHKVNYGLLVGNDALVNKYKVTGFPTTLLIDPQRQIQKKYVGARSAKDQNVERDIQALLAAWGKEE